MVKKLVNVTCNFIPVRTNLSLDRDDARRRVLNLYKSWYRQIPIILYDYHMPITPQVGRSKLREIFIKNSKIDNISIINALVIRGQMELNETVNKQKEDCHLWKFFREDLSKPKDFISKFLNGR